MLKHIFLRTIVVVTTVFLLSCSIKNEREEVSLSDLFYGYGFTVKITPTIVVKSNVNTGIDFNIYHFFKNGIEILTAYEGEHPQVRSRQGIRRQYTLNNGVQVICFDQSKQDKYSAECIVKLYHNHKKFLSYIHFWHNELQEIDKALADAIINSVERINP